MLHCSFPMFPRRGARPRSLEEAPSVSTGARGSQFVSSLPSTNRMEEIEIFAIIIIGYSLAMFNQPHSGFILRIFGWRKEEGRICRMSITKLSIMVW